MFYSKGRAAPSFSIIFFFVIIIYFSYLEWGRKSKKELKPSLAPMRSSTRAAATPNTPKPTVSPLAGCKFKALGGGEGQRGRQRRSWSTGPTGQAGTTGLLKPSTSMGNTEKPGGETPQRAFSM